MHERAHYQADNKIKLLFHVKGIIKEQYVVQYIYIYIYMLF
jgi:hypothetical protein